MVVHARDLLFLEALTGALRARGHVVPAASPDERVVAAVALRCHPHVCLLDIGGHAWREAACLVRTREPALKVALINDAGSSEARRAYDDHVVHAVVDQGCDFDQLDAALVLMAGGGGCTWTRRSLAGSPTTSLTMRERQVLDGLVRGATTTGIAEDLGISAYTVRTHVQSVLRKLGVHTRSKAVSTALAGIPRGPGTASMR